MPEDFSQISRKSVWALIQHIAAIGDVLKKKELPYDSVTPSWHNDDGTDNFTIGICARMGKTHHFLNISTRYFDATPEPQEMYPPNCCAIGTLEIFSSEHPSRQAFEVCGTPERWMVHHDDNWVPLSAPYVGFLMGMNQKGLDTT